MTNNQTQVMSNQTEQDFQKVLQLFEEMASITGQYITGGWTPQQWNAIGGECRTLEDGCNIHSSKLRKDIDERVKALATSMSEVEMG